MTWLEDELDGLLEVAGTVRRDEALMGTLERICQMAVQTLESGGKILRLGNGGSATDALHLAEELTGRFRTNRRALAAVCLSADGSALTCIGNDFGFDQIFAHQVEALAAPGDLLVGCHNDRLLRPDASYGWPPITPPMVSYSRTV